MARKKSAESSLKEELKKSKGMIIGTREVIKNLRANKMASIYLASNCDAASQREVERYASLVSVPVSVLSYPNDELGVVCKRQHAISMLGFLKE